MAILHWQHNRSRTKSGGVDKNVFSGPQEWFSRHTSEPSRQALTDLVKEHKRERSDDSKGSKVRSRGNTITSSEWPNNSTTNVASDNASNRSTSPQQTREGSVYSSFDKSDITTKGLLNKGSLMLRRSGSKMSLSSAASGSNSNLINPLRHGGSSISTRHHEELRNKISLPFDFQHVTHTEQNQVTGIAKINDSSLADKFAAPIKRSSQNTNAGDASPGRFGTAQNLPLEVLDRNSHSSAGSSEPPAPPPKDQENNETVAFAPASPVANRSIQASPTLSNAPVRHVPTSIDTTLRPTEELAPPPSAKSLLAMVDSADCAKPLPMLPIIHAVTTEDGSARAMMAVPLPTTPSETGGSVDGRPSPCFNAHQRQKSSVALPRHFSLRPSAKASMPNLLSHEGVSPIPQPLPRHRSDLALSQQMKIAEDRCEPRMSMSFNAIDTLNWEDAVDEAWDDADQYDDDLMWTQRNSARSSTNFESLNTYRMTPSSFSAPSGPLPSLPSANSPAASTGDGHKLESVLEDEHQIDLSGLGISAYPPMTGVHATHALPTRSSGSIKSKRRSSQYLRPDLTRSSSQESIILSIASSINGTQRSSNSSLMPEDILGVQAIEEESAYDIEQLEMKATARPESGCLPANVLQQISKMGLSSPTTANSPPMPPMPPVSPSQHKHSKSVPRGAVPDRVSSMAAGQPPKRSGRSRSNTTGARPRQSARISYSLFPSATPPTPSGPTPAP